MDTSWLFAPRYFNEIAKNYHLADIADLQYKKDKIANWQKSIRNKTVLKNSEIQLQTDFLQNFFVEVLEYTPKIGNDDWNLDSEFAIKDGKRADGYLGYFSPDEKDIRVVIELKDANTDLDRRQNRKDSQTPVEQAFNYAHKVGTSCKWVILSNFREIRLYPAGDSNRYESFQILELDKEDTLKRFLFLLHKDRLILKNGESQTERHFRVRQEQEQSISKAFYSQFKSLRTQLFEHLRLHNPTVEEFTLLSKAQKILDRIIFVFFCEDSGMLPYKIIGKVLEAGSQSFSLSDENVWLQLKGLFQSIDKGNPDHKINRFNGGLFASDPLLDKLIIKDDILKEVLSLENYDFESDLNVNILGHIFEQSISDIEEIKAIIAGEESDKKKGKRKKDGIFYTPEYITRYIVKEAVGGWLEDRKVELGIDDLPELTEDDFKSIKQIQKGVRKGTIIRNVKAQKHYNFWRSYKEKLANIKVVDPACGSGAFLVQVFDFLFTEGQMVNQELAGLSLGLYDTFDLHKHILSSNIFGVDLNEESVEITKLSLWLKTANKQSELTALDNNILCGNSLIDDPVIVGEKAFSWEERFKAIFKDGGFDVVVGNPPYVKNEFIQSEHKNYFRKLYKTYTGKSDLYVYFFEKAYEILSCEGQFAFIVSSKYTKTKYGKLLIDFLNTNCSIKTFIDLKDLNVFENIAAYPSIIHIHKEKSKSKSLLYVVDSLDSSFIFSEVENKGVRIVQDEIFDLLGSWKSGSAIELHELFKRLSQELSSIENVGLSPQVGIKTGFNKAYLISSLDTPHQLKNSDLLKTYLIGKNIKRYSPDISDTFILLPYSLKKNKYQLIDRLINYPLGYEYLSNYKEKLSQRAIIRDGIKRGSKKWFELQQIKTDFDYSRYIIYPDISDSVNFTFAENKVFDMTCFGIQSTSKSLLGILNSNLIKAYLEMVCVKARGGYLRLKKQYIISIPIPQKYENSLLELSVSRILELNKNLQLKATSLPKLLKSDLKIKSKLSKALLKWFELSFDSFLLELKKAKVTLSLNQKSEWMEYFEDEKAKVQAIQAEIDKTDKEIDQMVYALYGLTEEEIAIVEESVK